MRGVIATKYTTGSVKQYENSVEELPCTIRNKPYSFLSDNSLVKSVEFAKRCNKLGVEAKVVLCLAMFQLKVPILNLRMPIIGLHFYVEALGKHYECSYFSMKEKQNLPIVLTRLGRFKVIGSKSSVLTGD